MLPKYRNPTLPFMSANIQPPKGWRFLSIYEPCQYGDYWFTHNRSGNDRIEDEDEYGWEPINYTWYTKLGGSNESSKPVCLKDTTQQYWIRQIERAKVTRTRRPRAAPIS